MGNPICPYCDHESEKVTGKAIYRHRPDLYSKTFYFCSTCDAYVGCNSGTNKPLGRLADAELRKAKNEAHRAFDPLWRDNENLTRSKAYRWLSEKLGIDKRDCHIGMFDVDTCRRVVAACQREAGEP